MMFLNNISVKILLCVLAFFIFAFVAVRAQSTLTLEEQQKLQQLLADPALQQQFAQNPTALLQTLLANPETRDLVIKLLFPTSAPASASSSPSVSSLLNPLPDLLKQFPELNQYLQFLPSSGALPTSNEIQQLLNQSLASNTVELNFLTPTPLPNEEVRVVATLPTQDFRTTNFSWSEDGKVVASGVGRSEIAFTSKSGIGANTRISVSARLANGTTLTKSQTFRTADAIITIGAQSQTPTHYRGFSLPTRGSRVALSAIALVPSNSGALSYRWFLDGMIGTTNGSGTFDFETTAPLGGSHTIRLETQNTNKTVRVIKTISIPVARPQVFLYQDPVSLIAMGEQIIKTGEKLRINALPYFFNSSVKELSYRWQFLNNEVVGQGETPNVLEAIAPAQNLLNAFRSSLRVMVENPQKIFEQAQIALPLAIQ